MPQRKERQNLEGDPRLHETNSARALASERVGNGGHALLLSASEQELAWQSFDLRVAHKLNLMGNKLTAKGRELWSQERKARRTQNLVDHRSERNAISNPWLTEARTVAHTPEKSRPHASKLKRI
jgi:hypothetical protein